MASSWDGTPPPSAFETGLYGHVMLAKASSVPPDMEREIWRLADYEDEYGLHEGGSSIIILWRMRACVKEA